MQITEEYDRTNDIKILKLYSIILRKLKQENKVEKIQET